MLSIFNVQRLKYVRNVSLVQYLAAVHPKEINCQRTFITAKPQMPKVFGAYVFNYTIDFVFFFINCYNDRVLDEIFSCSIVHELCPLSTLLIDGFKTRKKEGK